MNWVQAYNEYMLSGRFMARYDVKHYTIHSYEEKYGKGCVEIAFAC